MGWAQIVSGGPDGRYVIRLDYGEQARLSLIAALDRKLLQVDERIVQAQAAVDVHDAKVEESRVALAAMLDAIIDAEQAGPGSGSSAEAARKLYADLLGRHQGFVAQGAPNRIVLAQLKAMRSETIRARAAWLALRTLETRAAWCADFTEDASGYVATLDIPGDSGLILVAPGGRSPVLAVDGNLAARELMSPEQCYFNAAILPGWQIDRPTYRWGTLTHIAWDANLGNVSLAPALSTGQRLDGNRVPTLNGVEFDYMHTDCRAFNTNSRVVLDLREGWEAPKIIGFLDNPRPDPPTKHGSIPGLTFVEDEAGSQALASYWLYGSTPRTYDLHEGVLPAGLTIDHSAGTISGTPTESGAFTGLVVRCSDGFYVDGLNRRYDDSDPFTITVYPAAEYFSGALDGISFIASSGVKTVGVALGGLSSGVGIPAGQDGLIAYTYYSGTGSPPSTDAFVFCLFDEGYPPTGLYARITVVGDTPGGSAPGAWVAYSGGNIWDWSVDTFEAESATFTIDIATDAGGTNIVATITGSIYVESI